jgi:murein DD-endopeptidase MepM/ murein hydrolase activator NlpD
MRTIHRFGAAVGAIAVVVAPAAVAAPALDDATPAPHDSAPRSAGTSERGSEPLGDLRAAHQRELQARRERRNGHFHPVVAESFDYGEAGAEFGASRSGHVHEGQDIFAPSGTPLVAVADGEVVGAGSDGGRGNYVSIHDPDRDRTYNYFHMLEAASVQPGEAVRAGQRIGALGCTGSCFGEHLHFEVRRGTDPYGPAEDPLPFLDDLPQIPNGL